MDSITKSGRTVEEATLLALEELEISADEADVEIVNEGNKGFLGILGGKEATVIVTKKEYQSEEYAKEFLTKILTGMAIKGEVTSTVTDGKIELEISGENMGLLIGRRGETLNALQYIVGLAVNKKTTEFIRVTIDTENYKKKREETLISLANRLASNAVKYRRNITLDPMSSYERRIIHSTLQDKDMISTFSTGEEPNRKVVIVYKGENN